MLQIKTLSHLTFHRNGIGGEPFFSALLTTNEDKGLFLATFEEKTGTPERHVIDWSTCRIVDLKDLQSNWRGDVFADALTHYFRTALLESGKPSIYDLIKRDDNLQPVKEQSAKMHPIFESILKPYMP